MCFLALRLILWPLLGIHAQEFDLDDQYIILPNSSVYIILPNNIVQFSVRADHMLGEMFVDLE